MIGKDMGSTIVSKIRISPAPSIRAASITASGMLEEKYVRIMMT